MATTEIHFKIFQPKEKGRGQHNGKGKILFVKAVQ